ncbi:unannotated protein [freshwater metagenome]|uniref:Unannotated protein n=1 Tax=freshwater metagenome TaxID=449393 RepID=A0A6J6YCK4_9ZZZZ
MARRLGVSAEQTEHPITECTARCPRLLSVNDPAAALIVACCSALDASKIRTGIGFRPTLTPQVIGRGHARKKTRLLLIGSVLKNGWRQEEDAVLCHALRTTDPVVLLFKNQPLPQRRTASTEFLGPRNH